MSNLVPFQGIPLPKDWPQHIKLAVIHMQGLKIPRAKIRVLEAHGPAEE